jgi:hypothetical protein
MRKIIFLDIDGVLATPECLKDGMWGLVDAKQTQFKKLMEVTNAEIVLSSSWRKWDLATTIEFMKEEGFWYYDKIIGITIRAYQYLDRTKKIHLSIPRGVEIQQWIDTNIHSDNGKNFNRKKLGKDYQYVILDDENDMLYTQRNNFIHTHPTKGLITKDIQKAIKILNNETI